MGFHDMQQEQQVQQEQQEQQAGIQTGQEQEQQNRFVEPLWIVRSESKVTQRVQQVSDEVRLHANVRVPAASAEATFAYKSNEQVSSSKRNREYHRWGSALNRKRKNFHEVKEQRDKHAQMIQERTRRLQAAGSGTARGDMLNRIFVEGKMRDDDGQEHDVPQDYQRALAQYMDQKTVDRLTGDETANDLTGMAVDQFLAMDLAVDLRTDKSFAANAGKIEEIIAKTDAISGIIYHNADYQKKLMQTEEGKERWAQIIGRLDYAITLSRYCKVQRMILTNKIYRSHYQSELGLGFREGMENREQEKLRTLIWMGEALRVQLEQGNEEEGRRFLRAPMSKMLDNEEEHEYTRQISGGDEEAPQDLEAAKNNVTIEDGPHAEYFRAHNHEGDPIYETLRGNYRVTGDYMRDDQGNLMTASRKGGETLVAHDMGDTLARQFAAFRRWKGVQAMPAADLEQMLNNLSKRPANEPPVDQTVREEMERWMQDNAGEIAECREANIRGLLQLKGVFKRHIMYLRKKYGDNLQFITREEQAAHADEMTSDFTDFQSLGAFVRYIKEMGLFYSDDESDGLISDSEFEKEMLYYDGVDKLNRMTQTGAVALGVTRSYSNQRRLYARALGQYSRAYQQYSNGVVNTEENFDRVLEGFAQSDGQQESGINWGCPFSS